MALSLEPGFLDFDNLPDTNFSCVGKVIGGYYADLETNCQMFHVCTIGQLDEPMDIRFLCLNGTVFDQETRVCERIDEVDCSKSEQFYSLNLELYGNTQPAILPEESPETDQPLVIKSTTTTTTTPAPKKTSRTPYYTTATTTPSVTTPSTPQVISTHHFPLVNSPDIRFNPEEINISLHPGAPPDIRTKPVTFQQQSYSDNNKKVLVTTHSENSDNKKVSVTTHSTIFDEDKALPNHEQGLVERPQVSNSQKSRPSLNYVPSRDSDSNFHHATPSDINYEFTYHDTEQGGDYQTEEPQSYNFHADFRPSQKYSGYNQSPHSQQFKSSTFLNDYTPTTSKLNNYQQKPSTTVRNYFLQSLKPPPLDQQQHYGQQRTEKAQRVQLPLPGLPTLPPLTFSSPAPFSLQRHIETKRYTKDHQAPPRIIISASASVSDASGRRLNYSLGTIGAAEILEQPPQSYDEYKDDDVGLDPFYHDVPKIKRSRTKREVEAPLKHTDIIRNEQEAVDVLKFLFEWYKNNARTKNEAVTTETVPISDPLPNDVTELYPLDTTTETVLALRTESSEDSSIYNFKDSALFNKKSKYSIIGNDSDDQLLEKRGDNFEQSLENIQSTLSTDNTPTTIKAPTNKTTDFVGELFQHEDDYVNDNYEPIVYDEKYGNGQDKNLMTSGLSNSVKGSSKSLPKDYVDDNIEPIYYRDRQEILDDHENTKTTENDKESLIKYNKETGNSPIYVIQYHEPENSNVTEIFGSTNDTEPSSKSGDVKNNNINKITVNENQTSEEIKVEFPEKSENTAKNITTLTYNSEPKSEILDSVTTEKSTSPFRARNRGRVRKRLHNTTEKPKDIESKKIILEKITERAHTAKDDYNYLRTLYKVHTTTPIYNVSDSVVIRGTKPRKVTYVTPTIIPRLNESNDIAKLKSTRQTHSQPETTVRPTEDFIPIITTEGTVTSTTEKSISSTNKRRRSRNRQGELERRRQTDNRSHNRRMPGFREISRENKTISKSEPYKTQRNKTINEEKIVTTERSVDFKSQNRTNPLSRSDTDKEIVIEVNSSNIKNKFVPYSEVIDTTAATYTTVPPIVKFNVGSENAQFLNQLTINYKKLFVDIVKSEVNTTDTSPASSLEKLDIFTAPDLPTIPSLEEISRESNRNENEDRSGIDSNTYLFLTPSETINLPQKNKLQDSVEETYYASKEFPDYTTPSYLSELFKSTYYDPTIISVLHNTKYTSSTLPPTTDTTNTPTKETETATTTLQDIVQEKDNYPSTLTETITTESSNNWRTEINKLDENISTTQSTTLIQEAEPTKDFATETGQTIETIPTTQFSTETVPTTERTRSTKYLLIINTQTNPFTENISTTQTTERNTEASKTEYTQVVENIPTTQYRTEVSIQGEEVFPSKSLNATTQNTVDQILEDISTTLPTTESASNIREKQIIPNEETHSFTEEIDSSTPTTQWTTDELRQTILEGLSSFYDFGFKGANFTDIFIQDSTIAEKASPTLLPTESTQTFTEEVGSITKTVVDTTNKTTFGEVSTETNIVTITDPINNKYIVTTEKVERPLIEEIEHTTKSEFITTTAPQFFTTQRLDDTSTVFETTTQNPVSIFEDKTTMKSYENTVPQNIPTSQLESVPTTEEPIITTTIRTSYSRRGNSRRGSRPTRRRTSNRDKSARHRFSTETFTRRPDRKQTIEEEIIDLLTKKSYEATTPINRKRMKEDVDEFSTDAPLQRSINPTQAERVKSLPTTPLSRVSNIRKFYIFNCFGKEIDKFYPDPRDCRLFHYCTQGYSKNQLLDMKFVCDLNTYFDDEKLICTKRKPRRCL